MEGHWAFGVEGGAASVCVLNALMDADHVACLILVMGC